MHRGFVTSCKMLAVAPAINGLKLSNLLTHFDMKTLKILTSLLLSCFFGMAVASGLGVDSNAAILGISAFTFATSFLIPSGVLSVVCAPNCRTSIPMVIGSNACDFQDRKGGIPRLAFLECAYADSDPTFRAAGGWTNVDNFRDAICGEVIFVTGEILGSKPAPTFNKKRFGSCSPEKTVSGTQTITFTDYNHDYDNLLEFSFWDSIVSNKNNLLVCWITCDDLFYLYTGDWDIEIGEQSEDTREGNAFFAGTITLSSKDIITPVRCEGLNAMLNSFATTDCDYYL